ncbi:MAG: TVP38/TMEM64 family protein [Hyphomicrobiaceae bacterium]
MQSDENAPSGDSTAVATSDGAQGSSLTRWLPLLAIGGLMVLVFAMGWHKYLTIETVGRNYDALQTFIAGNLLGALLIYVGLYIAVVALSLPGGAAMTLAGGLLFGWQIGTPATVVAATIGATIIFLVAKSSFGEALAAKAGPWLGKLRDGFQENALSYLLFLRLVPAFPFFAVNLAPALLGVPLRTYVIGTLVGIIPGTAAFTVLGAGLGSVVEAQNKVYAACIAAKGEENCVYTIDYTALVTFELLAGLAALGVVALIPVALNWFKKRGQNAAA